MPTPQPAAPVKSEYYEAIKNAQIAELTKQRDALLAKVKLLSAIVREVPSIIVRSRLDAKADKPTHYSYDRHNAALNAREF